MKRLFLILPLIIILSACSAKPAPVKTDFEAKVSCTYNGVGIKAEIYCEKHNNMTLAIKEPECMNGYEFSFKNDNLTVLYNGLKIETESGYLPQRAFPNALYSVFKKVNSENSINLSAVYNSFSEYKGKCESGEFTITADFSTGYISILEIKSLGIKAEFTYR